jgi:hypothetical protein
MYKINSNNSIGSNFAANELVLGLEPSTRPHHQRPPASAFSPNHGSGRVSTAPAIVAGGTPFPDVARR